MGTGKEPINTGKSILVQEILEAEIVDICSNLYFQVQKLPTNHKKTTVCSNAQRRENFSVFGFQRPV